jgi:hypothetical protein
LTTRHAWPQILSKQFSPVFLTLTYTNDVQQSNPSGKDKRYQTWFFDFLTPFSKDRNNRPPILTVRKVLDTWIAFQRIHRFHDCYNVVQVFVHGLCKTVLTTTTGTENRKIDNDSPHGQQETTTLSPHLWVLEKHENRKWKKRKRKKLEATFIYQNAKVHCFLCALLYGPSVISHSFSPM